MDEKKIALQLNINNKNLAITVDKEVFEKTENGKWKKRSKKDEDIQTLGKYLKPPKSLDII